MKNSVKKEIGKIVSMVIIILTVGATVIVTTIEGDLGYLFLMIGGVAFVLGILKVVSWVDLPDDE